MSRSVVGHCLARATGLVALLLAACGPSSKAPTTCKSGEVLCGSACVNISIDKSNCGGCGPDHACLDPTGGTSQCVSGVCVPSCAAPNQLCNASVSADAGTLQLAC